MKTTENEFDKLDPFIRMRDAYNVCDAATHNHAHIALPAGAHSRYEKHKLG